MIWLRLHRHGHRFGGDKIGLHFWGLQVGRMVATKPRKRSNKVRIEIGIEEIDTRNLLSWTDAYKTRLDMFKQIIRYGVMARSHRANRGSIPVSE